MRGRRGAIRCDGMEPRGSVRCPRGRWNRQNWSRDLGFPSGFNIYWLFWGKIELYWFFSLRLDTVVFLSPTYNTFPRLEMFMEEEVKLDVKSKPSSLLEKSLLPQEVAQVVFSCGLISLIPGCWQGRKHVYGSCPVIGSSGIRIKPYLPFPLMWA